MEFENINEYMLRSREERRAHLKLEENCICIGGSSRNFRGLLAHHLKTTIPSGFKVYACHACNNGGCSNPNHLYWGSNTDNNLDRVAAGTLFGNMTEERRKEIGRKISATKLAKKNKHA